ncbi:winged helix-turn-helix transcriptional regulator, partial [bacterium]|nr:winged helix-turn-helix transcriptional regulator [bacterium]
ENRLPNKRKARITGTKPMRAYIQTATKAATHPVRSAILKSLKESPKGTIELEKITGEARYNLYHHLGFLEEAGLVRWKLKDSKTKIYSLKKPKRPKAAVLVFDKDDIKDNPEEFHAMIDSISAIEGKNIPYRGKIAKLEICLYYDWHRKA